MRKEKVLRLKMKNAEELLLMKESKRRERGSRGDGGVDENTKGTGNEMEEGEEKLGVMIS